MKEYFKFGFAATAGSLIAAALLKTIAESILKTVRKEEKESEETKPDKEVDTPEN